MATVRDRGRVRKERIEAGAFDYSIRRYHELQEQIAEAIQSSIDQARLEIMRQELDRRNVDILAGHDFDKPLGSLRGGATITSSREALEFDVELPDESAQPSYMRDTVLQIESGLAGGISPGFRVPPKGTVPDAETLEPEPGNEAVQVRVIREAVLVELSIVTRPAYSATGVDVRELEHTGSGPGMNDRLGGVLGWL
ncbi:MAG: HK97 family phage prohead protease [Rhodospirillales bacterium]|nr:HK97 family phage prohead protease [Rhodospirillales bacterium]MCY3701503.1 HK97 family phage prohead protease [Rhodospirillales bacterium]